MKLFILKDISSQQVTGKCDELQNKNEAITICNGSRLSYEGTRCSARRIGKHPMNK